MGLADNIKAMQARPPWKRRPEILLSSNTVKPMHGIVPRVILGKEWWDATRHAAFSSTDQHCIACGVYKKEAQLFQHLEGHEVYRTDYRRGRQVYIETVPLCHFCHNYIHSGRLEAILNKGEITKRLYNSIIKHGDVILKEAKLKKIPYFGPIAPWGEWRLVLEGKEYPPLYKDFEDWKKNFTNGENDE